MVALSSWVALDPTLIVLSKFCYCSASTTSKTVRVFEACLAVGVAKMVDLHQNEPFSEGVA